MGVAAAAVIVIAVAFFGNLPGPILRITHLGRVSTVSPPSLQGAGSRGLKTHPPKPSGSPTSVPSSSWSPPPTPPASPSASELCRSYLAGLRDPESGAEVSLRGKLATLAGGADPRRVDRFCMIQLRHGWHYPGTDHESRANTGQDSQSQTGGTQAAQGQPGPGSSPGMQSGTGASQSTQSAPGSGQGNQGAQNSPSPGGSPAP